MAVGPDTFVGGSGDVGVRVAIGFLVAMDTGSKVGSESGDTGGCDARGADEAGKPPSLVAGIDVAWRVLSCGLGAWVGAVGPGETSSTGPGPELPTPEQAPMSPTTNAKETIPSHCVCVNLNPLWQSKSSLRS